MYRVSRVTVPKLGSVYRVCPIRNAVTGPGAHFNAFNLERELILYGSKKQTPVSLKSLMETGKGDLLKSFEPGQQAKSTASELVLFQVACFLHRELPVRIAHRVEHLQSTQFLLKSRKLMKLFRMDPGCLETFDFLFLHSEYPDGVHALQEHIHATPLDTCAHHPREQGDIHKASGIHLR